MRRGNQGVVIILFSLLLVSLAAFLPAAVHAAPPPTNVDSCDIQSGGTCISQPYKTDSNIIECRVWDGYGGGTDNCAPGAVPQGFMLAQDNALGSRGDCLCFCVYPAAGNPETPQLCDTDGDRLATCPNVTVGDYSYLPTCEGIGNQFSNDPGNYYGHCYYEDRQNLSCTSASCSGDTASREWEGTIYDDAEDVCLIENDAYIVWNVAYADPYQLYPVTKTGDEVDFVTNSVQWYYCDALGTRPYGTEAGANVPNLGHFPSGVADGFLLCPPLPSDFDIFSGCSIDSGTPCCDVDPGEVLQYPATLSPEDGDTFNNYCGHCYENGQELDRTWLETSPDEPPDSENVTKDKARDLPGPGRVVGDPSKNCTANGGFICAEDEVCAGGYSILSQDDGFCCYAEGLDGCIPAATGQSYSCDDLDGTLIPDPAVNPYVSCEQSVLTADAMDGTTVCCVGDYAWNSPGATMGYGSNASLICYLGDPHASGSALTGDSLFAECCANNNCYNAVAGGEADNGNTFASGSALHTIESFDAVGERTITDLVRKITLVPSATNVPRILTLPSYHQDWSAFDRLSFDFRVQGMIAADSIDLYDGSTMVATLPIAANILKPTNAPYTWQRFNAVLPAGVTRVTRVDLNYHSNQETNGHVYLDNFVLSSDNPRLANRFCSAGLERQWLDSLNPPAGTDLSDYEAYSPYMLACNAQLSLEWTGSACCGSQTLPGGTDANKEYYTDALAGCWAGVPVSPDQTVAEAMNDPEVHSDILFVDGKFHSCGDALTKTGVSIPLLNNTVTTIPHTAYDAVGSYYCAYDHVWRRIEGAALTRILAAKLYNYTAANELTDYRLSCGPAESLANHLVADLDTRITGDLCVLTYTEGGSDKTIVGTSVTNIHTFLDSLRNYAPFYQNAQLTASLNTSMCDQVLPADDDFFGACEPFPYKDVLTVYYAPQFKLVLFTQDDDTFLADRSFVEDMIDSVLDFFKHLFGGTAPAPGQFPIPANRAEFNQLYLAQSGDLRIIGVEEYVPKAPSTPQWRDVYIEYRNFKDPSLPETLDGLIGSEPREVTYSLGENRFSYTILSRYAQPDPWNRLTNIMRLDDTLSGDPITDTCGNSIAGVDEECDGEDLKGKTCDSFAGKAGDATALVCTSSCVIDSSACPDIVIDCKDADGDGYSAGADCAQDLDLDCDDTDASIYPGAEEICGNSVDEDCSGADLSCGQSCSVQGEPCTSLSECCAGLTCTAQANGNLRCSPLV